MGGHFSVLKQDRSQKLRTPESAVAKIFWNIIIRKKNENCKSWSSSISKNIITEIEKNNCIIITWWLLLAYKFYSMPPKHSFVLKIYVKTILKKSSIHFTSFLLSIFCSQNNIVLEKLSQLMFLFMNLISVLNTN